MPDTANNNFEPTPALAAPRREEISRRNNGSLVRPKASTISDQQAQLLTNSLRKQENCFEPANGLETELEKKKRLLQSLKEEHLRLERENAEAKRKLEQAKHRLNAASPPLKVNQSVKTAPVISQGRCVQRIGKHEIEAHEMVVIQSEQPLRSLDRKVLDIIECQLISLDRYQYLAEHILDIQSANYGYKFLFKQKEFQGMLIKDFGAFSLENNWFDIWLRLVGALNSKA